MDDNRTGPIMKRSIPVSAAVLRSQLRVDGKPYLVPGMRQAETEARIPHTVFDADALVETGSESVDAAVRRQRISLLGCVERMGEERLSRGVLFVLGDGRE